MNQTRGLACLSAALLAMASNAEARPLASIKERGSIMLCANPNALPFAAKSGPKSGIQIELGRALAEELGVGLEIGWVIFPFHVARVDCDIVLDSIVDKEVQDDRHVRLSRPYQEGGVVLAFRREVEPVATYKALPPTLRIGAIVGSLARLELGHNGTGTIPFTFEDEMLESLGNGEIDVAAASPASVGYYNFTHQAAPVKVSAGFQSVAELNWTVAVGMRKADDALVDSINKALDKLIADGTVHRIYAAYGIEQRTPAH
ncbi:MAG TPA: transporter substrate-binding domain-containing protein [Candidatus Cybelea sp.]|nr:transporter substrate-binding domain-containing protein [Candidatus Cybelea sp.]